jgi:hypothetical protein
MKNEVNEVTRVWTNHGWVDAESIAGPRQQPDMGVWIAVALVGGAVAGFTVWALSALAG